MKWPDGVAYSTERIDSYKSSGHYQGSHGIPCWDCHNVHSKRAEYQLRTSIPDERTGLRIPISVENNSFCLACHATHGPFAGITKEQVAAWNDNFEILRNTDRSPHPPPLRRDARTGPEQLHRCHMATNHTFWVSEPEDTIAYKDVEHVRHGQGQHQLLLGRLPPRQGRHLVRRPRRPDLHQQALQHHNESSLANHLVQYFGPGGLWWNTTESAPAIQADWK